jgi:hypothetical protein
MAPNPREKASFLKENLLPIEESGQLKKIDEREEIHPAISFLISNGHTLNMIHPVISYKGKKVIYMADMIPTQAHIPVPYVMGYDVRPLDTMKEKSAVLADAALTGDVLFFEHDPFSEACIVTQTEKGVRKGDDIRISDL